MITQELLHELFEYKDGDLYWKVSRSPRIKVGQKTGCKCANGYLYTNINKKLYKTHRLIFMMHYGSLPDVVDHIDGNPLNNKIENLRAATIQQNSYNSKKSKANTTGVKNVCFDNQRNQYRVDLRINGKRKYFGHYNDIDYAKFVADAMRYKYHKEFSSTGERNGSIR